MANQYNEIEICIECGKHEEYIDEDEGLCSECRYVDCAKCGEKWIPRDEVCPHGIDGRSVCSCTCEECDKVLYEKQFNCVLVMLIAVAKYGRYMHLYRQYRR